MSESLKSIHIPVPSKETPTTLCHSHWLTKDKAIFFVLSAAAVTSSRLLPQLNNGSPRAFLCSCAVLLNLSAAMSTIALTVMRIELDFRLSRMMQGLGGRARFLYLHWIVCSIAGIACLIAVVTPYGIVLGS